MAFKFYTIVAQRLKLKVRKFWGRILRLQKLQGKTRVWWYLELTDQWTRDCLKNLHCNQKNWTITLGFTWRKVYFKELYRLQILKITPMANCQCRPNTVTITSCFPKKGYINFQTLKNIPLKRGDDKKQITGTFVFTFERKFLPVQLIYQGNSNRCLPKHNFRASFSVKFTNNVWPNTGKSIEFFEEITFPYFEIVKTEKRYAKEQHYLIIMTYLKDNYILKDLLWPTV